MSIFKKVLFQKFNINLFSKLIVMEETKGKGQISKKLLRTRPLNVADIEDLTAEQKSPYFSTKKTQNQDKPKVGVRSKGRKISSAKEKTEKNDTIKEDAEVLENTKNEDAKSPKSARWEPKHWQQVVKNLKIMRSQSEAPVDTMGCHKCADEDADEKTKRFHKLVALMLSSQTKDQTTFDAMERLKERGLTPKKIVDLNSNALEDLLKPVSFYKNKAKYLQKTANILIDQYDGDIPNSIEGLLKLPGIGPKMAHICMNTAWGVVSGIGVDVHVHRISNRLGWVSKRTKDPEATRIELESWLPSTYWSEVNHLLVGFGQTICTAQKPNCNNCLNKDICPSAKVTKEKSKKK